MQIATVSTHELNLHSKPVSNKYIIGWYDSVIVQTFAFKSCSLVEEEVVQLFLIKVYIVWEADKK